MNDKSNFSVQWHLTDKCNLKCKHCYGVSNNDELSITSIENIISNISETLNIWGSVFPIKKSINFTGGEPLLYNNLFKLIEYCNNEGFQAAILTNGTLVNSDIAALIGKFNISYVQISIDDINERHDFIRGVKNSFNKSVGGAKLLINKGVQVNLSCTISRLNIEVIEELLDFAVSIGVSTIRFTRLIPIGNGKLLFDYLLSSNELKCAYRKLINMKIAYSDKINVLLDDPLFALFESDLNHNFSSNDNSFCIGGCSIGYSGICIMPDGTVYPCRKLPISIGNIAKINFRDIWNNSIVLNDIRDKVNLRGKCGNCSLSLNCKGCRALAYSLSGDYLGCDVQCWANNN